MSGETAQSESGWTIDTLKEFEDLKLAHEREMRELQKGASDLALKLQAEENARHFSALNGEQARIAAVLNATVQREVFENYKADRDKAERIVANQLAEEKGARAQTTRWITVALFAIAAVTFILKFIPTQAIGT